MRRKMAQLKITMNFKIAKGLVKGVRRGFYQSPQSQAVISMKDTFEFKEEYGLPDSVIESFWIFKFFMWWNYHVLARFVHDMEIEGIEHLQHGQAAVLIGMHTTHIQDHGLAIAAIYYKTGRISRGNIFKLTYEHFSVMNKYFGYVPGVRSIAIELLRRGFMIGVLPGGAEESLYGHENAYTLHPKWNERRGYVEVAQATNSNIHCVFIKNGEEMRWAPVHWIWNLLGLSRVWQKQVLDRVERTQNKTLIKYVLLFTLTFHVFSAMFLRFVVPVKLKLVISPPIDPKEHKDPGKVTKETMESIIKKEQPYGHRYLPGLKERFCNSKLKEA
jgi:hypothetical protein